VRIGAEVEARDLVFERSSACFTRRIGEAIAKSFLGVPEAAFDGLMGFWVDDE